MPCDELATSMITLSLAHHMPLWLAITIYVPAQLPCGLWQVIWYSLVGLEKIFCLAHLIWTYNRIGKAPASHKSSKPPQVMLDFADGPASWTLHYGCCCFVGYLVQVLQWVRWLSAAITSYQLVQSRAPYGKNMSIANYWCCGLSRISNRRTLSALPFDHRGSRNMPVSSLFCYQYTI